MGYPTSQYVKEDDSECSTYQYVKRDSPGRSTCPYVKRDGSICGKSCWRDIGCSLHWKLYDTNIAKFPCGICGKLTISGTGYCPKHAKRVYFRNWYERQKVQRIEADE